VASCIKGKTIHGLLHFLSLLIGLLRYNMVRWIMVALGVILSCIIEATVFHQYARNKLVLYIVCYRVGWSFTFNNLLGCRFGRIVEN
jgi:hypothetical protein